MKKLLIFGGIAIVGVGLYRYFKYQVDLALNYDFRLKNFQVINVEGNLINVSATFSIVNKSSFKVEIKSYDLQLFFKDNLFATTHSIEPVTIMPNSTFEIKALGAIDIDKAKIAVLPFVKDVLDRKPINIAVTGVVDIVFLGIPTNFKFDNQNFNYSIDLIDELKLSDGYERLKSKYPKFFKLIGVS